MCHVFRCDVQARAIANTLRDICKKILIERSLAQSSSKLIGAAAVSSHQDTKMQQKYNLTSPPHHQLGSPQPKMRHHMGSRGNTSSGSTQGPMIRPTSLGFNDKLKTRSVPAPESFPTPMEEPRKVLKAMFLGQIQVCKPCGVDVINEAIDNLVNRVPMDQWKMVSVMVAPSTVTINFTDGKSVQEEPPIDCRVRFLSFLGIARNDQKCAFIMHTAQDTFVAYAFHCEGSAGPLCKTIEAACKLRYQKCLDARPRDKINQGRNGSDNGGSGISGSLSVGDTERRSISSTLKNMFGSIAARRHQTSSDQNG